MDQTPQDTSQPAPGWYFAQGDPPGTERYWSGAAWEGTYRAVGGFSPTEVETSDELPTWLKIVVWVLSVMKALPLILLGVLVALWGSITAEIQDDVDFEFRDFSLIVLAIGVGVIVIGAVLLLGQLVGATKNQPGRVAVFAGIMTALDAVSAIGSLADTNVVGIVLFVGMAAAQAAVFVVALRIWNDRKSNPVSSAVG